MTAVGIEGAITKLAALPLAATKFPYDFLEAFGNAEIALNHRGTVSGIEAAVDTPKKGRG